ncbi:MAG: hypothetical protein R6W83_09570 [Cryobacterium sp.]
MNHVNDDPAQRLARQNGVFFDTVAMYEALNAAAVQEIAALTEQLAAQRITADENEEALRVEIQSRQAAIFELEAAVAALESSASWRVTRPLRFMASALRRGARR